MFKSIALTLAFTIVLAPPMAEACTGIRLVAADHGIVAARTLEFGFDLKSDVLILPAGTMLTGTLPGGGTGLSYKTKYGMVGANAIGLPIIIDGINDQGLYVGLFYFPGYASYPNPSSDQASRGMGPHEYGAWLLGNFATVDEVKANFNKVVLFPVVLDAIGAPAPVHFVVHDRTGKAVVVEPVEGQLKIYDNPLGIMSNAPGFDWHMTNLRNYINLRSTNAEPIAVGGMSLAQFGQGSGMHGLPGDFTPPSRFVRAAAFSLSALPVNSAPEAVLQAFHFLNNFDIPVGSVRDAEGGKIDAEYTLWSSAADLKNLKWYFKTYTDQTIRMVDLRAALSQSSGLTKIISMDSQQAIVDVTTAGRYGVIEAPH